MNKNLEIREVLPEEYTFLGELMVDVYSNLKGFPTPQQQPNYYEMLSKIGKLTEQENTQVLVALNTDGVILGGIVYFSDMSSYGSGGTATEVKNASGIRLLGVSPEARGFGVGKTLALSCIEIARKNGHSQIVLHTTEAMQIAWSMYQKLGFERSEDLDFLQQALPVFGFRLKL